MNQKKFTYYICCIDPKIELKEKDFDTLYSGIEMSEKQIKKLGLRFHKEIPSLYEEYVIASSFKAKDVLSYKKLGDLIFDFADSIITDILIEEDNDEMEEMVENDMEHQLTMYVKIFSRIIEKSFIIKKTNEEDKYKVVSHDVLFNCYRQILEERGEELFDFYNEDGYIPPENYDCIELFYKTIKQAMTKFDKAVLIFNDGDAWDVNKKKDNIWFGMKEEQDDIFKARLSYKSGFEPISCILRVITDSKKGNEPFVEVYGFFCYRNEKYKFIINNTEAEELKMSYSFHHITKQPLEHLDTDIYCDLTGERLMNI